MTSYTPPFGIRLSYQQLAALDSAIEDVERASNFLIDADSKSDLDDAAAVLLGAWAGIKAQIENDHGKPLEELQP